MSHFLARMVERARGTAPRVEPLLAQRYARSALLEEVTEVEAPPPPRRESREHETPTASERRVVERELPAQATKNPSGETAMEVAPSELLVPLQRPAGEVAQPPNWTRGSESLRRDELPLDQSVAPPPFVRHTHSDPPPTNNPIRAIPPRNGNVSPNEISSTNERPIVRVTIGRIEVRASPAVAAAPRKKTAPAALPLLSIDAYAQAKKEGRR